MDAISGLIKKKRFEGSFGEAISSAKKVEDAHERGSDISNQGLVFEDNLEYELIVEANRDRDGRYKNRGLSVWVPPGEDFAIKRFGNIIVVDNLPVVPQEKFEKLEGVVRKIYSQIGVIKENGLWMPIDEDIRKT